MRHIRLNRAGHHAPKHLTLPATRPAKKSNILAPIKKRQRALLRRIEGDNRAALYTTTWFHSGPHGGKEEKESRRKGGGQAHRKAKEYRGDPRSHPDAPSLDPSNLEMPFSNYPMWP